MCLFFKSQGILRCFFICFWGPLSGVVSTKSRCRASASFKVGRNSAPTYTRARCVSGVFFCSEKNTALSCRFIRFRSTARLNFFFETLKTTFPAMVGSVARIKIKGYWKCRCPFENKEEIRMGDFRLRDRPF